jgi:ubiquinone/menaquinone biosynthesis C-methylase UbiE
VGYVFDFHDSRAYDEWASRECNRYTTAMQSRLMVDLLNPAPGESILDIGCGFGASSLPLIEKGLNVTGLDPSPYMLELGATRIGNRVDLYRAYAEDLPFDDNSFNHAVFFISLEFTENPLKAIEEAFRVAKDRVFFGFLNRFALKGVQRWRKEFLQVDVFNHARLFTSWEMKKMVRSVAGPVPISWRTVCQPPSTSVKMFETIEQSGIVQRCPFGAFVGLVVTLVPRFRTRPLAIRFEPEKHSPFLHGSAPVGTSISRNRTPHPPKKVVAGGGR